MTFVAINCFGRYRWCYFRDSKFTLWPSNYEILERLLATSENRIWDLLYPNREEHYHWATKVPPWADDLATVLSTYHCCYSYCPCKKTWCQDWLQHSVRSWTHDLLLLVSSTKTKETFLNRVSSSGTICQTMVEDGKVLFNRKTWGLRPKSHMILIKIKI